MDEKLLRKLPLILFGIIVLAPLFRKGGGFLFLVILTVIFFLVFKKGKINLGNLNILNNLKNKDKNMETIDMDKIKSKTNFKKLFGGGILLIFLLWLFFSSIIIIDAGETGVYSLFGKVSDKELKSGFHLVIPLARVHHMSIRTEEYTMSILSGEGKVNRDDSIRALTKEGLDVDLDITVLYRLEEEKATDVYRYVGLNYEQKIIRPEIRSSIREIIANYEAKDIYSEKRQEAVAKIVDNLKNKLEPRGIVLEDVLLRNVQLPSDLAKSIQEKLRAEQEAQKYDFILEKELKEKERKIIEAEGQRESQKIINESLSQNYLYYSYIKELKDREGTIYVPTSPSTGMPLFRNLGN
jgi:regulator of protease activity HflC (stomatin/prohibitin superfamily)